MGDSERTTVVACLEPPPPPRAFFYSSRAKNRIRGCSNVCICIIPSPPLESLWQVLSVNRSGASISTACFLWGRMRQASVVRIAVMFCGAVASGKSHLYALGTPRASLFRGTPRTRSPFFSLFFL